MKKVLPFFKPAQIYPVSRFLVLELPRDTELEVAIQAKEVEGEKSEEWGKYTFGPFLPGKYKLTYDLSHPKFGVKNTRETADLLTKDHRLTVKEASLYEDNQKFQKHLLASAVSYFESMNEGIREDLDVSKLMASKDHKEKMQLSFDELKPYMESFDQQFQNITINCDSITVNTGLTKVQLDLYIDLKRSIKLLEEVGINEALVSDKQNAVTTFLFDEQQKKWLVAELDFETYQQKPEEWEHIQRYRAEIEKKARWSKEDTEDIV